MAGLLDKISSKLSRDADPNKPTKEELRASEEQARRARLDALEEQARARCTSFGVVVKLWSGRVRFAELTECASSPSPQRSAERSP
jgi:hypothetical protein